MPGVDAMGWMAEGQGERLLTSSMRTIESEGMAWKGKSQDKTLEETSPKVEASRGTGRHKEERASSEKDKRLCMAPLEVRKANAAQANQALQRTRHTAAAPLSLGVGQMSVIG